MMEDKGDDGVEVTEEADTDDPTIRNCSNCQIYYRMLLRFRGAFFVTGQIIFQIVLTDIKLEMDFLIST